MRWGSSELEAPPEDGSRTERREGRGSLAGIRGDLDETRFVMRFPARGFFAAFLVLALLALRFFFIGSLDPAPDDRNVRMNARRGFLRLAPVVREYNR